jgi:hypothetical protein
MESNGTFKTSDIVLSAWLMSAHGAALIGTDNADPQRVKFILRPQPTPAELAEFSEGDALCPVHSFYGAFKRCKAALFAGGAR